MPDGCTKPQSKLIITACNAWFNKTFEAPQTVYWYELAFRPTGVFLKSQLSKLQKVQKLNVYTCYEVNIESTCVQESVGVNIIEKSTNTSSQVNIGCSS